MDYFRLNNQIQADFAYRVGKIAELYGISTQSYPDHKVYEDTLHICLLQNLLTSCSELIKSMSKRERAKCFFSATFTDIPSLWGLRSSMVIMNTFYRREMIYEDVLSHLRNALSHPTSLDLSSDYPSTGFDSINPVDGQITTYAFVDSPDVKRNRQKFYEQKMKAEQVMQEGGFPCDAKVREISKDNGVQYEIWFKDKPFVRIFRIDIPANILKQFVLDLSNHLSLAIQPKWEELLAAKEAAAKEAKARLAAS